MRVFPLLLITLFAGGCVQPTAYQEMGETGGVTALPLGAGRFKIEARGNGLTSPSTVSNFLLLKAAETTLSAGATHFIIVDEQNRDTVTTGNLPAQARTTFAGSTAYTTVHQPQYHIPKPGRDATIQVYSKNVPDGALKASDIVTRLKPVLVP